MIDAIIAAIRPLDEAAMQAARNRQDILTKPTRALGRLEDLSIQLAGITRRCPPPVPHRKAVLVFAGDHGVTAQGVSAYPKEVTGQMVLNFLGGGAAINVLARQAGARVVVVDAGVASELPAAAGLIDGKIAFGTADMSVGPAMTREQAAAALELGARVAQAEIDAGLDLLACGEMGIGNTTPASAIVSAITGTSVEIVTGPGTGVDADGMRRKAALITKALLVNEPDPTDGLDMLAKVGGFEIGAIAGAMLAAAAHGVPVVVDGFISGSAALIAATLCPLAKQYMIAGHQSTEPGHVAAMGRLGLTPLIDMRMRLGEGTGAVLAMHLVDASARIINEMATFESAGVSNR
ncbi:MAG: nicotinate-nucleotide--dimethylbenzimidazole phosphoribosyltransferase [Anaerolineae bacterium]|jgi:nicotinate-nucleotide--dimethylbenzimidazole phosphoribosyltransferase|nr:nicotinate-nucleotide--dimethylbenzimidazole phosphoribosyltransferase [Anaerolineae bacterium]